MKKILVVVLMLTVAALVYGFISLQAGAVRSLEQVGISSAFVKECIWSSLSGGYLNYPSVSKLKQIASGDRAAAVNEIATYAKNYTRSEDFKQKYIAFREGQKPTKPDPPRSMADQRREDKATMQKQIREMEATMKQLPADQRQIFKQTIDVMKEQLKEFDNPNNPMYSPQMDEMNKQIHKEQMEEYKNKLAEWERDYPVSPTPMIRKWLTQFLEETRDVDYNAKLTTGEYGKMVFVNPAYESKTAHWKMCYRAGKPVVDAGRAAAQQWLNELK